MLALMKGSCSSHATLIQPTHDELMTKSDRSAEDLLDVARVLLLVQGSILIATTIEAVVWSAAFAGAAGLPAVMSGAVTAAILVARARLRADRSWTRRLVYGVEGVILAAFAIDAALAVALIGAYPPAVAFLTRLFVPISVILLLRDSARPRVAPAVPNTVAALEGVS